MTVSDVAPAGASGAPVRLVARTPALTGEDLAARFVPPHRFADVRFATYRPNPDHPSQAAARARLEAFAADVAAAPAPGTARRRRFGGRRRAEPSGPPGRYLDGGFGVGKTHLLASLWYAVPGPSAYLTFAELAAVIGYVGMEQAVASFSPYRLLCIDEFELDDVANTLLAVTFLRTLVAGGTWVAATSNAVPDRLGEGRFHAEDFRREIAAIAEHFEVVRIDGPDFRNHGAHPETLDPGAADRLVALLVAQGATVAEAGFDELLVHLRRVHPAQVGALLDGIDAVVVRGLHPVANQGDALLWVHLVDELYDAGLAVVPTGCRLDELFAPEYRHGGYRTKYGRCESRLAALVEEAEARLAAG